MATQKIKTSHAFTKPQLISLNKELEKISNAKIIALRGVKIQAKENYSDIQIYNTPYSLDVFLSFTDMSVPEYPKFNTYKIESNGNIDYDAKANMKFNSLSDRITFFNTLQPIQFHY